VDDLLDRYARPVAAFGTEEPVTPGLDGLATDAEIADAVG